ncbi:transposase family protein [Nocardia sp. NPDC050697]|uniref:transposase family protein n=1 Tax=Nocardia sp. NPDC050697 TaxID=3155158 RepID=UPI0033E29F93
MELIAGLAAEVEPVWRARQEARVRVRAQDTGARNRLVFLDRLLVTLVYLRHGVIHDVLAAWFDVDRSTVTRGIGEIRPILAERGCRAGNGTRLRMLDEVVEFLGAAADYAIMDATEVRVRRSAAGVPGRDKFVSGESRQNAIKTTVITDSVRRLLFCGATAPGSVADITQARRSGLLGMLAGSAPESWPTPATSAWAPRPMVR